MQNNLTHQFQVFLGTYLIFLFQDPLRTGVDYQVFVPDFTLVVKVRNMYISYTVMKGLRLKDYVLLFLA